MSLAALDAARSIAARIVNSLGGRGVFGVELLVRGDEVYFATVRPAPGDSGLVTLRSQRLSQFELHARAILGLPLDTIMISPAAAEVVTARLGRRDRSTRWPRRWRSPRATCASSADTSVALATAPDVVRARDRAHRVVGRPAQCRVVSGTEASHPASDPRTGPRSRRSSGALAIIVLVVIGIVAVQRRSAAAIRHPSSR